MPFCSVYLGGGGGSWIGNSSLLGVHCVQCHGTHRDPCYLLTYRPTAVLRGIIGNSMVNSDQISLLLLNLQATTLFSCHTSIYGSVKSAAATSLHVTTFPLSIYMSL